MTTSLYPASSPSPQDAITRCLSGGRSMVYSAQTSMQNIKYVRIGRPRRRLYQDPSYDDGRVAMNSSQQNGRDSTSTMDHMGRHGSFSSLSHICAWTIMTSGPIRRLEHYCGDQGTLAKRHADPGCKAKRGTHPTKPNQPTSCQ